MLLVFQGCVGDYCCFAEIAAVEAHCENADTDWDDVVDEEQPTDQVTCQDYGGLWFDAVATDYIYLEEECYLFKSVCENQCDGMCLDGQFHD